jgi:hypothetical protein
MIFFLKETPKMKNMNRYALGLALGLGLLLSNAGLAQTITQSDQKKTTESCCAIACCYHDSASMEVTNEHSAKHESCYSGDSCNMKMKDGLKNRVAGAGCCGCGGDSSDMKMKDSAKNHAAEAGCACCSGDSCDMKMKDSAKNHAAGAGCCCGSGDSCEMNMKDMKNKEEQGRE